MKKEYIIIIIVIILIFGLFILISNKKINNKTSISKIKLTSPNFKNNGKIPEKYTCNGEDINPALKISNIPENTKSLAIIMDDPDAPAKTWTHWIVFNIDPKTTLILENSTPKSSIHGVNDFKKNKYNGPCPPSGTHRYFFKLYALNKTLNLKKGVSKSELEKEMKNNILDKTELIGLYTKK